MTTLAAKSYSQIDHQLLVLSERYTFKSILYKSGVICAKRVVYKYYVYYLVYIYYAKIK
jgi:hypothetical protein